MYGQSCKLGLSEVSLRSRDSFPGVAGNHLLIGHASNWKIFLPHCNSSFTITIVNNIILGNKLIKLTKIMDEITFKIVSF